MMNSYGITETEVINSELDVHIEELKRLGYTIMSSNFDDHFIHTISNEFDSLWKAYLKTNGGDYLKLRDEHNTIRCPYILSETFFKIASSNKLLKLISSIMGNNFILNQQNGIINPPKSSYNQAYWHRDLPYQHFVSSRPLALNALYCVDEFTIENGSTEVIPSSHLFEKFPSPDFVVKHALKVSVPAGSYVILDSMLYHKGGSNKTSAPRRAINNVFATPIINRQIMVEEGEFSYPLNEEARKLLGLKFKVPSTVNEYLESRSPK